MADYSKTKGQPKPSFLSISIEMSDYVEEFCEDTKVENKQ